MRGPRRHHSRNGRYRSRANASELLAAFIPVALILVVLFWHVFTLNFSE